jgi:hypothetical protein
LVVGSSLWTEGKTAISFKEAALSDIRGSILFDLGLATVDHVREDAADRPEIDALVIMLLDEDDFWWTVPS